MYTLKELVDLFVSGKTFEILFGDFLDYFYSDRRTADERFALIKDEPIHYDSVERKDYAFLAATAHTLALTYKLPVPAWVMKDFYFLDTPYFALDAKSSELRRILMQESPPCFSMRNLFVSENVLCRV